MIYKLIARLPLWMLMLVDAPVHALPERWMLRAHNIEVIYQICLTCEFLELKKWREEHT